MSDDRLSTDLVSWEAKILLELLLREEERLRGVSIASTDEDEVADAQDDLARLMLLLNRLRSEAVAKFGKGVLNFDKDPL